MENSETQGSLEFAEACGYINKEQYLNLLSKSEEVGKLLHHMITNPKKYQSKNKFPLTKS